MSDGLITPIRSDVQTLAGAGRVCHHALAATRLRRANLDSGVMFIIELIYKTDLAKVDAHMKPHIAFLRRHYAAGTFLISGRKIPRDGGVILAVGDSREQIEAIARQDPFVAEGVADYRIIEFRVSQRADDLDKKVPRIRTT